MGIISRQTWLLRLKFHHKLCTVIFVIFLVYAYFYKYRNIKSSKNKVSPQTDFIQIRSHAKIEFKSKDSKPTILFWAPYITGDDPIQCMRNCPVQCKITHDKNDIETADLINFDLPNLWSDNWNIDSKATVELPKYRRPDQIWSVTNLEPPSNLFGDLGVFNGVFNWTVWYRKDATLYLPYGTYKRLDDNEVKAAEKKLKQRNFYKEKTGNIVGMISNCKDPEQRYRFVAKLAKYLNMTTYGKCFDKVCGDPFNYATCEDLTRTFKFYLGLENNRCTDYVTEKYWHSLHRGQIPIVNWDLNHIDKSIPIPGSFISVSDFKTIEHLAEYIDAVSKDEELYNSYFDWMKKYKLGYVCVSCLLCEALHQPIIPQTVFNFDGWVRHDVCEKVNNFNIKWLNLKRYVFQLFGI